MAKRFISLGIDHGTSNSSIAAMESRGPRVIKPDGLSGVIPSVVYLSSKGRQFVGRQAREAMLINAPEEGDGHTGYKRYIGQDLRYEFRGARRVLTGPELGALIIGELLRAYREETGADTDACVITFPAKWEQSNCEGTRAAARLAGLRHFPLLQEPVAAALAYGFQATRDQGRWLVFDLGGGTLDVSLVFAAEGNVDVPREGNAGDEHLGGTKFDRELMEFVLGPLVSTPQGRLAWDRFGGLQSDYRPIRATYQLAQFSPESQHSAWGRLLLKTEEAKIELSKKEEAFVEVENLCRDDQGKAVDVKVRVTRSAYERLIAPEVDRAIVIVQNLLRRNRLEPSDIAKLILIGGPTHTPYIRHALQERLGIPLEYSIDPMTAVAMGAAIYAATLEVTEGPAPVAVPSETPTIRLEYEGQSAVPTCSVSGQVVGDLGSQSGLTVEIQRTDGLWTSARLPLEADGFFTVELPLIAEGRAVRSEFTTTVRDRTGRRLASIDEPRIWYPFPGGEVRLANSLVIGLKGEDVEILLKQGEILPARKKQGGFVTSDTIHRGSAQDVLRVPVYEAVPNLLGNEEPHVDCCALIGTLEVLGSDRRVTRDIPAGAQVDISLEQDRSRQITASAHIPLLDEDFEVRFSGQAFDITEEALRTRFAKCERELEETDAIQRLKPIEEVASLRERIRTLQAVESIQKELERAAAGEKGSLFRAYKRTLELAGTLRHLRRLQRRARLERQITELESIGNPSDRQRLQSIRAEFNTTTGNTGPTLDRLENELNDIDLQIRRRPYFDLLIDLMALSGRRVTAYQHSLFKKADALYDRLAAKGGLNALTDADIAELTAMHRELGEAHPELEELRRETIQKLPLGENTDISTIARARAGS